MKYLVLALSITFIVSCEYGYVKRIDDRVKNEVTYIWNSTKNKYSTIYSQNRTFYISFVKKESKPEIITINISSTFPVTYKDYQDTAYIIVQNRIHKFPLRWKDDNVSYKEKEDIINNFTTTNTDVKTQNTTVVTPVSNDTQNKSDQSNSTTNTTTTTTTQTDHSTSVQTDILDKISSERYIEFPIEKLSKNYPGFKIRIYSVKDDDFWELNYTNYDYTNIMKVAKSIASSPNN